MRPLLRGLPPLERPPGIVGFVAVMIGTVTFDGLSQGALWKSLSGGSEGVLADTIGLLLGVALVAGFYWLGMAGAKTVGGGFDTKTLARAFVHSLVPIAAVYVAAHYLTFLIFEGQAIRYTAADPFGQGWDLFGWAERRHRLRRAEPERRLVPAGRAGRARARRRARTGARPGPVTLRSAAVGGALAILDAGDHDRLHDARAVAARTGGQS